MIKKLTFPKILTQVQSSRPTKGNSLQKTRHTNTTYVVDR